MVMARVRYCEDCTVTIWVPGTGEQGVAGVTIAARDTLRWSLSMLILECFVSYNCVDGHCFVAKHCNLHALRLRVSPTRQQVYSEIPDWVVGDSGDQVRRRALLVFNLFICLHF